MSDKNEYEYIYRYVAVSNCASSQFPPHTIKSPSSERLTRSIKEKMLDFLLASEGVNSYETATEPYSEPYSQQLTFQAVTWDITREKVKVKKDKNDKAQKD